MPTVYQDRCDISLYDAQYSEGSKRPIPQHVIKHVLSALLRFKRKCQDFGVRTDRVRVVATEATREALNSKEYREQIESMTDWKVEMLAKEEEGRIGAMGISSSFSSVKGLALDLGGGSIQMTWVISKNGEIETSSKGSVSFPYGAAALMNKLKKSPTPTEADRIQDELAYTFRKAIDELDIPQALMEDTKKHGLTIYLSGGGFRGWGHILMSMHAIKPYPIPIINGFRVLSSALLPNSTEVHTDDSIFRISTRRASQVPAVTFIITALTRSLPNLASIYFAQGGLREGLLFSILPPAVRAQHPLVTTTLAYAPSSTPVLVRILSKSIPPLPPESTNLIAYFASLEFLTAIIHLLNAHSPLPKDIRPAAALRSTTTGLIAGAHGISHDERALLALTLCERWGGEISPSDHDFQAGLTEIVGAEASWWAKYVGRVAQGLGSLFPAGLVREGEEDSTVRLSAQWGHSSTNKHVSSDGTNKTIKLEILGLTDEIGDVLSGWREGVEKVGKRKNWTGRHEKFGWRVETT